MTAFKNYCFIQYLLILHERTNLRNMEGRKHRIEIIRKENYKFSTINISLYLRKIKTKTKVFKLIRTSSRKLLLSTIFGRQWWARDEKVLKIYIYVYICIYIIYVYFIFT